MNEKKIAFIMCVSDERQLSEACYYIGRLHVPEDYEIDIITIKEAPSMTEGYQAGMESSDAKYKVYMHQDVFLIDRNFIYDFLHIFASDEQIGMIGCVGCRHMPEGALVTSAWDTGFVYHNCIPQKNLLYQDEKHLPVEVEAVDGLLMVTQYDIHWRTDLFDGWHYYDISQCMEMKRKGYKVVVPFQNQPWCYHDNTCADLTGYYDSYKRFTAEYQDIKNFIYHEPSEEMNAYEKAKKQSIKELRKIVDAGEAEALTQLFKQTEYQGFLHLKEFEILANITQLEDDGQVEPKFWEPGDDYLSLAEKMQTIRFALKRVEYDAISDDRIEWEILRKYSREAIGVMCRFYEIDAARVMKEIGC